MQIDAQDLKYHCSGKFHRGVASLSTSGGPEMIPHFSSFFYYSPIFHQFFLIFVLNLALWVGGLATPLKFHSAVLVFSASEQNAQFIYNGVKKHYKWVKIL